MLLRENPWEKGISGKSLLDILWWFIFITTSWSSIFLSFPFYFFKVAHGRMFLAKRKLVKPSGWKSLIWTVLRVQKKRRLTLEARLRNWVSHGWGSKKMLISCGNPQASLSEHCATMQELVAAAVKSHCSEKAQANVLASLWGLFMEAGKAGIAQSRSAAEQEL